MPFPDHSAYEIRSQLLKPQQNLLAKQEPRDYIFTFSCQCIKGKLDTHTKSSVIYGKTAPQVIETALKKI